MQPTTQTSTIRSVLIYALIGAVLFVAVIFGIRWAKGRSDHYANAGKTPVATQQQNQQSTTNSSSNSASNSSNSSADTNSNASSSSSSNNNSPAAQPSTSSSSNTSSSQTPASATPTPSPARMPSTGIEDAVTPLVALFALTFLGVRYAQSRRRLMTLG